MTPMDRYKQLQALAGQKVRLICQGKETGRKQHIDGVLCELPLKHMFGVCDDSFTPLYVMSADDIHCINQSHPHLPPTLFMEVCDDGTTPR